MTYFNNRQNGKQNYSDNSMRQTLKPFSQTFQQRIQKFLFDDTVPQSQYLQIVRIFTIIFFHQTRTKMETSDFSTYMESMQKAFNRVTPKLQQSSRISSIDSEKNPQRSDFSKQVEKKIMIARSKICQAMQCGAKSGERECLSNIQTNMLRIVSSRLGMMNREYMFLLDEGILTLYIELLSLVKSSIKSKIRTTIKNLIKDVCKSLKPLLIHHFVYQEYLLYRQKIEGKNGNSYKQQNKAYFMEIRMIQDAEILKGIQDKIQNASIQQLLKQSVKIQERKIKETVETCRICFRKIQLEKIQAHVKLCQKQNTLRQNIEQKTYELAHLKSQMKRKCDSLTMDNDDKEFYQDLRLISRILLNFERKEKTADRRCSLIGVRSQKHIGDNLQILIQEFMETHGYEPLLQKILDTYKQKVYLQKKLNQLQIHSLHHKTKKSPLSRAHNKQNCSLHKKTPHILTSIIPSKFKTTKKLAHQKQADQTSQDGMSSKNSIEKQQNSDEQEKNDPFSVKLLKSKRALSIKTLKDDPFQEIYTLKQYSSLQLIIQSNKKEDISLNNFEILNILGQGAFGKVYMVRRKQTRDIYALKIIKIPDNSVQTTLQSIKRQHQIFKKIAGQHLVKAPFSFSQKSCHIFILEYLPGGDLRKLLNEQVYLDEQRARAYLAEIVLAIEHLHNFNIIHRDLKPENLVFDRLGHLKLTDFGLSQFQMQEKLQKSRDEYQDRDNTSRKTRRRREAVLSNNKQKMKLIGTPDYIAPEIIFKTSLSNFSIDWWSLGVMAYQLMVGTRPFCAETIQQVIDNITNLNIQWPEVGYQEGMISPQAKDLICQLLNKDFMHRLGAQGAGQIKSHPFFESINWETIKNEKPLAIPKITNMRQCIEFQQDVQLRREINQFLQQRLQTGQRKRTVDLENFIRFDLLGSETIQNVHKIHQQQCKKLSTLKELQQNFLTDQNLPELEEL